MFVSNIMFTALVEFLSCSLMVASADLSRQQCHLYGSRRDVIAAAELHPQHSGECAARTAFGIANAGHASGTLGVSPRRFLTLM